MDIILMTNSVLYETIDDHHLFLFFIFNVFIN